ncbi:unnamed protein product [Lactuca saligna]|uniref:Uncharacterized protein n=1 Tax=Lactuca saligna TaxID=75948 RepID=A0AA36ENQ9_LACSI|nr:unnamed protein product [Lactuca saligna]
MGRYLWWNDGTKMVGSFGIFDDPEAIFLTRMDVLPLRPCLFKTTCIMRHMGNDAYLCPRLEHLLTTLTFLLGRSDELSILVESGTSGANQEGDDVDE